jgi:hypothetical protein
MQFLEKERIELRRLLIEIENYFREIFTGV